MITLSDNLTLRWARAEDKQALAEFNKQVHGNDETVYWWTLDLLGGGHPTTQPEDFTVVMDGDRIVSSACVIWQTWTYGHLSFPVARPELIGTDENYRKQGLVRHQMNLLHKKCIERNVLVQAITGIPYFYRQFGYEPALPFHGGRFFRWSKGYGLKEDEQWQVDPAGLSDIPLLDQLYQTNCQHQLVSRLRDEAVWRYELVGQHPENTYTRRFCVVRDPAGNPIGYFEYAKWPKSLVVREVAVVEGQSLRDLCLFITRAFTEHEQYEGVFFHLGIAHPAYEALNKELTPLTRPYGWYMRVADLPAFLRHISPVLNERLASSVMAGYTGQVRLNFFTDALALVFEQGRLTDIQPFQPKDYNDGDAFFPELTFLQLLFGYRSVAELEMAYLECAVRQAEFKTLLPILFPKCPSNPIALG